MFAQKSNASAVETRRKGKAYLGIEVAAIGLFLLGYPLPPAATRMILIGLVLPFVAVCPFFFKLQANTTELTMKARAVSVFRATTRAKVMD